MTLIEYTLDGGKIPSFVIDGGHWVNPDDNYKMIGVGLEGSIPDNITTYSLEELQTRQLALHAKYPMKKGLQHDGEEMTNDEVNAAIKEWVDAR